MPRSLAIRAENWPIAGRFVLSRGAKTEAHLVVAEISAHGALGRGEAVPYPRYGQSTESVIAAIESQRRAIEEGLTRAALQEALPPGPARNALDCALIDLEAKASGTPAPRLLSLPAPKPLTTAFTLSLDSPEAMGKAAEAARGRPLLKLKLGPDGALERVRAVRQGAPDARLIVDANEAWTLDALAALAPGLKEAGVVLIEQPLPAGADEALEGFACGIPLCADESLHSAAELPAVARRYDAVNIKLDKTGGLTAALQLLKDAKTQGLAVMAGCMVSTSLAMAPAFLLAALADFVDLDGPLLLAKDRPHGIRYAGSLMSPPDPALWG